MEQDYRLQRLVYALACFRSGAREVEVVYHFLERPDATVSAVFSEPDVPVLEAELCGDLADPGRPGRSRRRASTRVPAVPPSTSSVGAAPARRAAPSGGVRAGLTCDR